jgi:hypothetical protein
VFDNPVIRAMLPTVYSGSSDFFPSPNGDRVISR